MNGPLPRAAFVEAHRLLIETFTRHDLRLLLLETFQVRLYDIASPDVDHSALCLGVIDWADRNGRLNDLIRAGAGRRPAVGEWQVLLTGLRLSAMELLIEAHRLLVDSFGRDELQVLVRTKLGDRMELMTTPMVDNSAAALDVAEWFQKRQRLCELVRAAAADRPAVPAWQRLQVNNCPPAGPAGIV